MIYWTMLEHHSLQFIIAATNDGLCFTGSLGKGVEELERWQLRHYPHHALQHAPNKMSVYAQQLTEYLQGEREHLTFAIEVDGTPFQRDVWHALQKVPYGETRTYSDIAIAIQKPTAVRAVASAIGANPVMIVIPCHRIIGKNGKLTGFRGGLLMKEHLLKIEGVSVKE